MKYLNFITDCRAMSEIVGSSKEEVEFLESILGYKFPLAFKEYLLLMGRKTNWYEHGTNDIVMLRNWISEWIKKYR